MNVNRFGAGEFLGNPPVEQRKATMKNVISVISLLIGLSGCAIVNEMRGDFSGYRPMPIPGAVSKDVFIEKAKEFAGALGKTTASDSSHNYLKYNDLVYKSVNTVYSCNLVIANLRDSLFLNLRQCKVLDVDPISGQSKWFETKADAPNSPRQSFTDYFYYKYLEVDSVNRDSMLAKISMPVVLDDDGLNKYINPRAGLKSP